jgi:AcrR family transcriptional regulator
VVAAGGAFIFVSWVTARWGLAPHLNSVQSISQAYNFSMDKPAATANAAGTATVHSARRQRRQAMAEVRRSLVLDAARAVFFEQGLEGASLREIARRAGYTAGALYSYFDSKEAIYGALLGESLERLNAHVAAAPPPADAATALQRAAGAFFDFYRENPRDLDLGFYLFRGLQPRGLTPALDDQLNARLADALAPAQQALRRLGLGAAAARSETTALFAHIAGLLLLSHTGRIRMFGQDARVLLGRYLGALAERASAPSPTRRT